MQGEMRVIDRTGDSKLIWDTANPDEVEAARSHFNLLKEQKRYAAFKVKKNGEAGEVIRDFDPEAGMIIMRPQLQGG